MPATGTYTILYIEDNESNRMLVDLILQRKEYLSVIMAADGKSGLEMAKQHCPDLILLDISLPDMNGYNVLAELRKAQATATTPVVAISGDFPPRVPPNTTHDFNRYLAKPIAIAPLYQAIDELLPQR